MARHNRVWRQGHTEQKKDKSKLPRDSLCVPRSMIFVRNFVFVCMLGVLLFPFVLFVFMVDKYNCDRRFHIFRQLSTCWLARSCASKEVHWDPEPLYQNGHLLRVMNVPGRRDVWESTLARSVQFVCGLRYKGLGTGCSSSKPPLPPPSAGSAWDWCDAQQGT